ncbi:hypothetical protein AAG906_038410 [Vitis piasezkii]
MPPRRLAFSQNKLYRYLKTLAGLVDHRVKAIDTQALGQPSSSRGTSFDDLWKCDLFICGKKHWGKPCYKEFGACFGCEKHEHTIWDCLENKKFIIGKPKEENKEDKQKPRVQGRMFAMTHQDAQATSDVAIGTIRICNLLLEP